MAWPTTSRHARGYGTAWDKTRKLALERDKYLCQPCLRKNRVTPAREVNHRIPKAAGGTDDLANLESTCTPCHKEETARQNGQAPKLEIGADGWPVE